jgi:hypothetical protein
MDHGLRCRDRRWGRNIGPCDRPVRGPSPRSPRGIRGPSGRPGPGHARVTTDPEARPLRPPLPGRGDRGLGGRGSPSQRPRSVPLRGDRGVVPGADERVDPGIGEGRRQERRGSQRARATGPAVRPGSFHDRRGWRLLRADAGGGRSGDARLLRERFVCQRHRRGGFVGGFRQGRPGRGRRGGESSAPRRPRALPGRRDPRVPGRGTGRLPPVRRASLRNVDRRRRWRRRARVGGAGHGTWVFSPGRVRGIRDGM